MNKNEIRELVRKIIKIQMSWGEIPDFDDDTVLSDVGIDSLKAITIMFSLEDELEIEVPTEAIERCQTIDDIVNEVSKLKGVDLNDASKTKTD